VRTRRASILAGPVAVCAPSGKDAEMIAGTLRRNLFECRTYAGMAGFCISLEEGAEVGIIAEEALVRDSVALLLAVLNQLPAWSDPPIIILGAPDRDASAKLFEQLSSRANLTLVERPTRPFTLAAVTQAALRARARQHEAKALLEELENSRAELARHRDELAEAVRNRTRELQTANQALRLSERMAAIGTLSAGIGHDIANLLLPVRVHIEALEHERDAQNQPSDHVAAIRACIGHLQRLAAGLRQLALDPEDSDASGPGAEDTDLRDWWLTVEPIIRNTLPRGVKLESEIPVGLRAAVAAHQLSQAVVNLVQNAGDAISLRGGGAQGCVRVTARAGREGGSLPHGLWPGDDRVRVCVSDNGPGMSEEVKRRCLEPLFTTKSRRLSTGLGLILVKGVVQRAGGDLQISSTVGQGTTFTMVFRIPPTARAKRPLADVSVKDARVAGFISSTLRSLGYEPRISGGAVAAGRAVAGGLAEGGAALWVTDPEAASGEELERFVNAAPDKRVVVLGPGRLASSHERVLDFPSRPGPAQLRETLTSLNRRGAAQAISGQGS
jgi:signal transduction histidine kinase